MYQVGDKISYPMHGAGVVEAIEERAVMDENVKYYVLRFVIGNMKIMLPVSNTNSLGLRDVLKPSEVAEVIEVLNSDKDIQFDNWNQRYRENLERLRSGNILYVADVVRILTLRDRIKGLSTSEHKMLNKAVQILSSEIILATEHDEERVIELINENIISI